MFCPSCGKPLVSGTRFCGGCGAGTAEASFSAPTSCTVCGTPSPSDVRFCAKCGTSASPAMRSPVMVTGDMTNEMHEILLMRDMTQSQQMFFQAEMQRIRKNPSTAWWLAFLLGGAGAHHFYLGNSVRGALYLCFCWTGIPLVLSLIDAVGMKKNVWQMNTQNAMQAAMRSKALMAA